MKKILSMVLAMMLMVAVAAAFAEEGNPVTGTWYLSQVIMSGTAYSNVAQIGLNMKVELNEDGTGTITMNDGNPSACAWKQAEEGYEFMEEATQQIIKMNVDENNNMLLGADNENCYIFSREQFKTVDFAAVKAAESKEEFDGKYALTYLSADGYTLPIENAMDDLKNIGLATTGIDINGGSVALFGQEAKEFSFVTDGTLYFDSEDGLELTNVKIFLLEDGGIALNWLGLTFYAAQIN